MYTLIIILSTGVFIVLLYFFTVRPWQLTWGSTKDEINQSFNGDDIVKKPHFVGTRAISIKAPPSEVWKWIIQIGSARAGWYSIDLIDNANVPSSREILQEYQKIEIDYFIPFTPDQKNGMWVKEFKDSEYILWWDKKGNGTWGWYLYQSESGGTRLITRLRTRYDFSFPWIIYYIVYDFGDIIMMSKCMRGIKERAEFNLRGTK
ncbi:MAG: hypothetical protein CVV24_06800 [Ignavibacteriae bacterium HGW-Ignavibacteriae-3]|nr:MAG: hypothetical protein CVV24_06800 [Ignavibacteriae bacterium HGW-Ignavibacteriae-3]